ncbi:MAG: cytochrome c biogenesis protein CcsA [Gammaproteobacteria bacterium]|nr:cytochrome c biogenesis protein CcsA [Gammaproteobacteria bacterium]
MVEEVVLLWVAISIYVLAGSVAIISTVLKKRPERTVLALLVLGLLIHGIAIIERWIRIGHGPYFTMYEILNSNIWSLTFIYTLAYWRFSPIRPAAAIVMPILFMMMGWMLLVSPIETSVPAKFDTSWLVIHILLGKVFLGAVLVAVGMAGIILLRDTEFGRKKFANLPASSQLDELAYRFMALGLIFDTLMIVAGAIWAQKAWGRYWSWDPVETWAFLTWLFLVISLHLRVTVKPSTRRGAWLIIAVFVLGFFTFFGTPFISDAPHKGAF